MSVNPPHHKTPEEKELQGKLKQAQKLEEQLAEKELELITLHEELKRFEIKYATVVGACYAKLDAINAEIAEELARLKPANKHVNEEAKTARYKAEESADYAEASKTEEPVKAFKPSDELKKLYRNLALRFHPDTTTDPKEKERRHHIMAEINKAYEAGDKERLQKILDDWESSPDSIKGEGTGADLVRTIRKIAQIKNRLEVIKKQMATLKQSELYHLMIKIEEEKKAGRDLLAEMAREINNEIKIAKEKLDELKAGLGIFILAFLVKNAQSKNIFILKFNGTALIGSGATMHMKLTGDPAISKEHAKVILSKKEGKPVPVIIDLGSENGTFVNDALIDGPRELQEKDVITIGSTILLLEKIKYGKR